MRGSCCEALKTLGPRLGAHQKSAMAVARYLDSHDKVDHVYYPGLESHPQHALAKKQQFGFGAMMSFDVKGGRPEAERVMENLQVFQLAESLGGVESLVEYRKRCHTPR